MEFASRVAAAAAAAVATSAVAEVLLRFARRIPGVTSKAATSAAETLGTLFLLGGAIMMLLLCHSPRIVPTIVVTDQTVKGGRPQGHYLLRRG